MRVAQRIAFRLKIVTQNHSAYGTCFLDIMAIMKWIDHCTPERRPTVVLSSTPNFLKFLVVGMLAGVFLLSLSESASAYVLEGKSWVTGSVVTLQLGLGTPPGTLQDGSLTWDAAVTPALATWNQQVQNVQFAGAVNPSAPVSSGDGVNSIVFASTIFGQSFGEGTLAVTYYRTQGQSMIEADVLVNSAQHFDSYRGPLQFGSNGYAIGDIRRIVLHELGHVIGLNHPDSAGQHVDAVMNSLVSDRETLAPDDIAGAQVLYGTPAVGGSSTSLLWQNNLTGERQIWSMNGTVHTGTSSIGVLSTQWNIATSGDFNGDGKLDIVWQNSVTGQRAIWLMNGATYLSGVYLPTVSTDWEIVSGSDCNGDGKADLLWQNKVTGQRAVWFMNRTSYAGSVSLGTVAIDWKITGSGDFNGDGKPDILWQNNSTGQRAVWLMNGTVRTASVSLGVVATPWDMVGTGDFNGDGKRDIIWQNDATGQRAIWLMNGTTYSANASLGTVATPWDIRNY